MRISSPYTRYSALSLVSENNKRSLEHNTDASDDTIDCMQHRKKRVRFETVRPGADTVKTYERHIDIPRSELDKPNMWWSRKERESITEECHDAIEEFQQDHIDQVRHFNSVFDQCQEPPSMASSEYLEKASICLPDHIRGLEWGWAPTTISHRRAHVKEILAVHQQIQSLSPEIRDRVLSSRSLRSSRPGRVLARLLGEGDEMQLKAADISEER